MKAGGAMEETLRTAALAARRQAYAPDSSFSVGAAVATHDGRIFAGCNVENSSYGITLCAERNAVAAAVAAGARAFAALYVVADSPVPVAPCGACRQVLAEFRIPLVIMANLAGEESRSSWSALLPYAFTPQMMEGGEK